MRRRVRELDEAGVALPREPLGLTGERRQLGEGASHLPSAQPHGLLACRELGAYALQLGVFGGDQSALVFGSRLRRGQLLAKRAHGIRVVTDGAVAGVNLLQQKASARHELWLNRLLRGRRKGVGTRDGERKRHQGGEVPHAPKPNKALRGGKYAAAIL